MYTLDMHKHLLSIYCIISRHTYCHIIIQLKQEDGLFLTGCKNY